MKLGPISRGKALGLLACLAAIIWMAGAMRVDARRQKKKVEDAAATIKDLGAIQESYQRIHGKYTANVFHLANMTKDWKAFMEALDVILDLRTMRMWTDRAHYRIEARARDRARSLIVLEGPMTKTPAAPAYGSQLVR